MQEYNRIDQRLHLLCQILAKVAANLIPEKEDYSHTNLAFDPIGKRILSRWIEAEGENWALVLDLTDFSFHWINGSFQVVNSISIQDKTFSELEIEIQSSLDLVGIKSNGFSIDLKYKIEKYPFNRNPFELPEKGGLTSWIYYRQLANEACENFLRYLNADGEVRLWPHHFDTGVYTEIEGKLGIGFGLAIKDGLVDSQYFYLSGYTMKDHIAMENLPELKLGSWITDDWNGAVLSLTELEKLDVHKQIKAVNFFIAQTLDWYLIETKQ